MVFEDFRQAFYETICFNRNQVLAWHPGFDKNNLGRWVAKGYIIKLKNGFYSFPEFLSMPDVAFYVANQIYKPSYLSLHSVLSFYELIPESVTQITSISGRKTCNYQNKFGAFSFQKIAPAYYFGYEQKQIQEGRMIQIAMPEKALLDLFYLNPFYNSENDMLDLRIDEAVAAELLDTDKLLTFCNRFQNKVLVKRIETLIRTYRL